MVCVSESERAGGGGGEGVIEMGREMQRERHREKHTSRGRFGHLLEWIKKKNV